MDDGDLARKLMEFDDDDDEILLYHYNKRNREQTRAPKQKHPRIDWPAHVQRLRGMEKFPQRYRMAEGSFYKLVDILGDAIKIDPKQSMRSTSGDGPITPIMVVAAGLRSLGIAGLLQRPLLVLWDRPLMCSA